MAPPSGGGETASVAAVQSHIRTSTIPGSSLILQFSAALRWEGWALRETVQNQALQ